MQKTSLINPQKVAKIVTSSVRFYKKKKLRDAKKQAFQLLSSDWKDPNTFFQVGVAAFNAGDNETSIPLYEKSLALNPSDDQLHANILQALGSSHSATNCFQEAIQYFSKSLEIKPENASALNNRSIAYLSQNELQLALDDLRKAHALSLNNLGILLNLGATLIRKGLSEEALKVYEENIALHSESAELHIAIAELKKVDVPLMALKHYRKAVALDPTNAKYLKAYSEVFERLASLNTFDGLENDLLLLLSNDTISWNNLNIIVPKHIKAQPAFRELLPAISNAIKTGGDLQLDFGKTIKALSNNVLMSALKKMRLVDPEIERLLELFRRQTLAAIVNNIKLEKPLYELLRALLIRLAHYCFANEYIFNENEPERTGIEAVIQSFENGENASPENTTLRFLILACYRNCHRLSIATKIKKNVALKKDAEMSDLIRIQITEPLSEKDTYEDIQKITAINDSISLSVQEQYEENPYPRWHHLPHGGTTSYAEHLARTLPVLKGRIPVFPDKPSVLIAGCGTGRQPISTARSFPETDVLAVDLSLASISYAMRKSKELKVKNITFGQADIMELGILDRKFNIIECAGVLHHMNDPVAGWRVLCDLLDDDGYMIIGLYSELGRKDVVATRQFIQDNDFGNNIEDIRRCRKDLMTFDETHPTYRITKHSDFFTTSACRDLIFHVQEHRFTIPQLIDVLNELGLEFLGFTPDRKRFLSEYDEMFSEDPHRTSLENWNTFEEKHLDTFATMYKFWVRKKR
ncbi:MAG: methyltransferase domain-containing protein [Sneathiella sp.]|nr:methyltransferase domain-containing protein [Sneathiella sp.]